MNLALTRRQMTAAIVVPVLGTAAVIAHTMTGGSSASPSHSARPAPHADVCPTGCTYSRLSDAVRDAHAGDTITIGAGTYSGGITLARSVSLVGAGPGLTRIVGAGNTSVVTIGTFGAVHEPTVDLRGLTITGGRVTSSPESVPQVGSAGVFAAGGGIEIPPDASTSGATVHLTHVVVSGNRVYPSASVAIGPPCPGEAHCPYAEADGGGIDNWGDLTLDHSVVKDNTVGAAPGQPDLASDADGGGIMSRQGHVVIRNSQISANTASAAGKNARYADAGGLFVETGSVALDHDSVTGNRVSLAAELPTTVDLLAIAGGVHVGGNEPGSVVHDSVIKGNSVAMTNSVGMATAVSGGLHADVDVLTVTRTTVTHNTVRAATTGASKGDAEADSGSGELSGRLDNDRFTDNTVRARSIAGDAHAFAGVAIFGGDVVDTLLEGNTVDAQAPNGAATAAGGGFDAGGPLTLTRCSLRGNTAHATGLTGFARGGAMFGTLVPDGPPAGRIRLVSTTVTHNVASAGHPLVARGGGIYTTSDYPLSQRKSSVTGNVPDDVVTVP